MNYFIYENVWDWGYKETIIAEDAMSYLQFHIENSDKTTACFDIINVYPKFREKGRGKNILEFAINRAKILNCIRITIITDKTNWMINWYKNIGFITINNEYNNNVKMELII